jgi:mRNA interferase HigB
VRVFNSSTLLEFGKNHAGADRAFRELNRTLRSAGWRSNQDILAAYPGTRPIKGGRVVFNVKGNEYRVIARIDFQFHAVFMKFVGTHAEYDKTTRSTRRRWTTIEADDDV